MDVCGFRWHVQDDASAKGIQEESVGEVGCGVGINVQLSRIANIGSALG